MQFFIKNIDEKLAVEILNWRYAAPYEIYNNEVTSESVAEMLDYHAIFDPNDELFGYFCIGESAQVPAGKQVGAYTEEFVDVGLGMRPDLTGKGLGTEFFAFILKYIDEKYGNTTVRLTVATFNKRAIHLYEKLGFTSEKTFQTETTEFMTMLRGADNGNY